MSEINKYIVTFPKTQIRINIPQLTFTIGNIKCRNQAVVYFTFKGYDYLNHLVCEHTSDRWIITDNYTLQEETFELEFNTGYSINDLDNYVIELYTLGIDSENPLYFNHLQLNEGEHIDYHIPNEEIDNVNIGFNKNSYINLYDNSETFLQIIRTNHEQLSTEQLTGSQMTILAPHLPNESKWDDPVALFYEFMYMTEQRIGVEK